MEQPDHDSDVTNASARPYASPRLIDYGTISELTLTAAAGPNFDGGGGSNIYTS
jgi:hypothetical protein